MAKHASIAGLVIAAFLIPGIGQANFHLGLQGEINRAYMNPEAFNGYMARPGNGNPTSQAPFSKFSTTYSGRLYGIIKERFIVGVQFSPYSFTNGGASEGDYTYLFNYKSHIIFAVLGLNLINSTQYHLDIIGGFGRAILNHVDLVYKANNTDLKNTYVYDGDTTFPKFVGIEAYYMFPRQIFGIGLTAHYFWYDTTSFTYNMPGSRVNDLPTPTTINTGQGVPIRDANLTEVNMNLSGFKLGAGLRIQY